MRLIYTVIYYLAIPFILIRLLWRSRHIADYRKRWSERFGYVQPSSKRSIWIHAVSVGETQAAIPLVRALLQSYGASYNIIVTTTTPTGSSLVIKHLGKSVTHVYAPFDVPIVVSRFLKRSQIKLSVIMETELWPNVLTICQRLNIPIILANGRLSERSCLRYQLIPSLAKHMLSTYKTVIAQGVLDGERYLQLGLDPKKLVIGGNIKFDCVIPEELIEQGKRIKEEIGERRVLIAASTHEGEEQSVLTAFQKIRQEIPSLFLILAPRHPQRFQKVEELCAQFEFRVCKRSQKNNITSFTDILLVDTIGELQMIYAAADIAFVGGSLVPVGGHNMIEPAAVGLPIITGPYLYNFSETSKLLQQAGASQIVHNAEALADAVIALCSAQELCQKMGKCAKETIEASKGALEKHLSVVSRQLGVGVGV